MEIRIRTARQLRLCHAVFAPLSIIVGLLSFTLIAVSTSFEGVSTAARVVMIVSTVALWPLFISYCRLANNATKRLRALLRSSPNALLTALKSDYFIVREERDFLRFFLEERNAELGTKEFLAWCISNKEDLRIIELHRGKDFLLSKGYLRLELGEFYAITHALYEKAYEQVLKNQPDLQIV